MMLEVKNLNVYYGAIHALKGIDFHLEQGEIVALIGANGAGKSTTLNTISGLLRPREGSIEFEQENISRTPPQNIVRRGIVQIPEGRKIFAALTVLENLEMGAYIQNDQAQIEKDIENAFTRFPRLRERLRQRGGTLSGGEQQMLAIARGLMARPKLLLRMSLLWGWRQSWWSKSSISSAISTNREPAFSWWNKTRKWRSPLRIAVTYWKPAESSWKEQPKSYLKTPW